MEEFVDEHSAFCLVGFVPQVGQVNRVEKRGDLIEAFEQVVGFGCCLSGGDGLGFEVLDLGSDAGLLLSELVGADLVVVVERQELVSL